MNTALSSHEKSEYPQVPKLIWILPSIFNIKTTTCKILFIRHKNHTYFSIARISVRDNILYSIFCKVYSKQPHLATLKLTLTGVCGQDNTLREVTS